MDSRRLEQIAAAGGIVFVVTQIVAQSLIQVGGAEPPFNAAAPQIMDFFMSRQGRLFGVGDYLSVLSLFPFVGWLSMLWARLRKAEGGSGAVSLVVLGCGLVTATQIVSGGGWTLAMGRIGEGLTPELARMLFDMGNLTFANIWVSVAGIVLVGGVLIIQADAMPKWLGWAGMVIGAALIVARAFWDRGGVTFAPYVFFWLWVIATSIILMRGAGDGEAVA